jgi:GNAT superfamily N-acetyltransferase
VISLTLLPRDRTGEVLHLGLGPGQEEFLTPMPRLVEDPRDEVDFHVVRSGPEAVGFFKIDRDWAAHSGAARPGDWGLRAFLIGAQYQGRGHGTAALAALPGHLRQIYGRREPIFLTVNLRNATAYRLYLAAGWIDTVRLHDGGRSCPERVLRLDLD